MMTIEELNELPDERLRVMCAEIVGKDEWVIVKRGLYYRPNGHGYTSHLHDAWKLPYAEAKKHEAYVDRADVSYDEKIFIEKVPPPNYPADLNAMHEAEKTLTEQQRADYADNLFHMTDPVYQVGVTDDGDPDLATDMFKWLAATARQRCIAFIAVKQTGEVVL